MNLVYGGGVEVYEESIKEATALKIRAFEKDIVFHAYWDGELSDLHLISVKTCWYFNVQGYNNRKIIVWVKKKIETDALKEISKYAEVKCFDFELESVATPFYDREFFVNYRPSYYSDLVRYTLLSKYGGLWFDLDIFFLRSMDPVLTKFGDDVFLYRWGEQNFPNGAIYYSPEPNYGNMDSAIDEFIRNNKGFGFNETKIGFDSELNMNVLPCSWFDGAWVKGNPYLDSFDKFFYKNRKKFTLETFFPGAFCFHWHNRWNFPINQGSIISDLYAEVNALIDDLNTQD